MAYLLSSISLRLLNTFAEENSIADAIFHLNDALKKEVIDLEVFLKVGTWSSDHFRGLHSHVVDVRQRAVDVHQLLMSVHRLFS